MWERTCILYVQVMGVTGPGLGRKWSPLFWAYPKKKLPDVPRLRSRIKFGFFNSKLHD